MRTTTWIAGFLTGTLLMAGAFCTPAAAKPKAAAEPQPITIEADELYFSDKTGEMFARGNVVITQEQIRIFADLLRGNDKNTEVWADGKIRLTDPLNDITGMKIRYNYGSQFGMMQNINGRCDDLFVAGDKAEFQKGKYTFYKASATTCPSTKGVPDYRVTARKVVIWPGVKMIAYNAKLWIKDKVIYSTRRYKKTLNREEEDDFPRIGYVDKDGISISQLFNYPLNDNVSVYMDLVYFTKAGLKPKFGIVDQETDYTMELYTGRFRDYNGNLIWKEPEFRFDLRPRKLWNWPVQYTAGAVLGQWRDEAKSSLHQEVSVYFTRDPLYLDTRKSWTLNLGTGYQYIREGYDASSENILRYNIKLEKILSPSWKAWTAYNYTSAHDSLFAYNRTEVPQEGIVGLSWKVNNRTTLSFAKVYDFGRNRVHENYYTIKQNFHCWEAELRYRAIKKELNVTFSVVKF